MAERQDFIKDDARTEQQNLDAQGLSSRRPTPSRSARY